MGELDRVAVVDALRDFNFEVQAFRGSVARHFGVGVRETEAVAHLVARGQLSATELARSLGLSPATVTHLLGRLTRAGLATTSADPHDMRRIVARPTAHGRAVIDEIRAWLDSCLDAFTTSDIELGVVVDVLTVLRGQLRGVRESLKAPQSRPPVQTGT